ncbi:MAG: DUF4290 domain-containing protein [Bacteroidota bacterium]
MEYNSQRNQMVIPEYGRMIQKMIEFAMTIEDRDERNRCAKSIVKTMGDMTPQMREIEDYNHTLWDHLFLISGFQLDVDSPYPIPSSETLTKKPLILKYPNKKMRFRHYGKTLEQMILKATEIDAVNERNALTVVLGNFMKASYLKWNGNSVTDEMISTHIKDISEGKLALPPGTKLTVNESVEKQIPYKGQTMIGRAKKKKRKTRF